jgi:hypothetical protein
MNISQLLIDAQVSQDKLLECKKKARALEDKCRRAPELLKKAVKKAETEGNKFSLMNKGVYTEEARELCRVLVQAGCSQQRVSTVIEKVLEIAGITIVGSKMSQQTVARAVEEGGVMADIQMGYEIAKSNDLTASGDGTTHKNVNYEARHINMLVSTSDGPKHQSRLVGVDPSIDHSSQTQAEGWKSKIQEKLDVYNRSPLAKRCHLSMQLADFFARLRGMNSDHAKDQKKLGNLLKEIKDKFFVESLGEERLLEMNMLEIRNLLIKTHAQMVTAAGGQNKWNTLPESERLKAEKSSMSNVILQLGREAYSHLTEDERKKAETFIWVGCAMHKDLNCVKGGNANMAKWWEENNITGPILLANKDNAAVLELDDETEEHNEARQRAQDVSSGGAVKLAGLAGMLFHNKNDKIGQQDIYKEYFLSRGVKKHQFPDTSNNRYQSYCTAAAELLTSLQLYIQFLEWIRDAKDKPGFTNMEKNIFLGLQDIPTQTELAVLTLYAQSISHPYMKHVRGPGTENVNMLDLGPLHKQVQLHIEKVIEKPEILVPPTGSYKSGTLNGEVWENPKAVEAIYQLSPSLPYLKPLLVAFFEGALETWKRFTSEFKEGGLIDQTTSEEKEMIWMPPTNDVNEGALGALRHYLRKNPNATIHYYNALAMFRFNNTAAFVQNVFSTEDYAFVHKEARKVNRSDLERRQKAAIVAYKDKQIKEKREKIMQKTLQKRQEEDRLAAIKRVERLEDVTVDSMTVQQLKDQLDIYRRLAVEGIPAKSQLKTKALLISALKDAIVKYNQ